MQFSKKVLQNGLRLITVPMNDNPTVTVLVLVEAGSKYETKEINGVSHFLEHMCFKGTTKRPSAFIITKELDAIGAQYNAFTGHEFTGYYAKADRKHIGTLVDTVSDLYLNPTFPEAELEREKGVVIEEINMYQDLPQRHVQDLFMELLYGDQPAGRSITGTKENVSAFNRKIVMDYRNNNYVSGATTVAVAGSFDEAEIVKSIERQFEGMSQGPKHQKTKVVDGQDNPRIFLKTKETDQTHIVLGVRTFDIHSKNNPALRVLSGVLGGGMSSRLFQKVREELAAGYYVGTSPESFTDHGFLQVAAGLKHEKVREVIVAVLEEFSRLKNEKVPAEELKKVKDYLTGTMYLGLESSDSLAEYYAIQEILRKPIKKPDEVAKEIESVTVSQVAEVARQIFKPESLNLAVIGRFANKEDFSSLLKL